MDDTRPCVNVVTAGPIYLLVVLSTPKNCHRLNPRCLLHLSTLIVTAIWLAFRRRFVCRFVARSITIAISTPVSRVATLFITSSLPVPFEGRRPIQIADVSSIQGNVN
jgi:hypothetical protein